MIDALRADFVFGHNSFMNFTKSLITQGSTYR
jgi:predicted AlkP superfamily pyrophosphatase or phosphodiesterase